MCEYVQMSIVGASVGRKRPSNHLNADLQVVDAHEASHWEPNLSCL